MKARESVFKLSYKIFFCIFFILLLSFFVYTILTIEHEKMIMTEQTKKEKIHIAEMAALFFSSHEAIRLPVFIEEIIMNIVSKEDIRFFRMIDSSGKIIFSNITGETGMMISDPALLGNSDSIIKSEIFNREEILVAVTPPMHGYVITLGFSLNQVNKAILEIIKTNAAISFLIIFFMLIIFYAITAVIMRPLTQLVKDTMIVMSGDLEYRIKKISNDEIGLLVECFQKIIEIFNKTIIQKMEMYDVFNKMTDVLIVTDPEYKISMVNKAGCGLFRYTSSELIGMPGNALFVKESSPFDGFYLKSLLEKGVLRSVEGYVMAKDGILIPVLFSASVIMKKNQRLKSVICIVKNITEQKRSQDELKEMHKKLLNAAHQAGMGEIACGVLHNIGNILTSAGVSAETIEYVVKQSKIPGIQKAINMFLENNNKLDYFLSHDPKGKLLPDYLKRAGDKLGVEYEILVDEVSFLLEKLAMIKNVIDTQQEYAFSGLYMEQINLVSVIEDTLKMQGNTFKKHKIMISKNYPKKKKVIILAQKTKVVDILVNCFKNAWEAMQNNNEKRILCIDVTETEEKSILLKVSDNGEGISEENIKKIFSFGFSTKEGGFGFGLHSCAIFMSEMGGEISAQSDGPGKGTVLKLVFPCIKDKKKIDN